MADDQPGGSGAAAPAAAPAANEPVEEAVANADPLVAAAAAFKEGDDAYEVPIVPSSPLYFPGDGVSRRSPLEMRREKPDRREA